MSQFAAFDITLHPVGRTISLNASYMQIYRMKKAWATSDTAKNMQAQFICMAHNLMLAFEQCLKKEGVVNEIENKRRQERLDKVLANSKTRKDKLPVFLTTPREPTQQSVKFIRWLRNNLYTSTSWIEAMGALKRIYADF